MSLAIATGTVDVSVLVPAKDEAENLPEFLAQCEAAFRTYATQKYTTITNANHLRTSVLLDSIDLAMSVTLALSPAMASAGAFIERLNNPLSSGGTSGRMYLSSHADHRASSTLRSSRYVSVRVPWFST